MDDWTHPSTDVVEVPDTQPPLLNEDGSVMEARRARAQQAEAARVAELEQAHAVDGVGNQVEADVPLPYATPTSAALAF